MIQPPGHGGDTDGRSPALFAAVTTAEAKLEHVIGAGGRPSAIASSGTERRNSNSAPHSCDGSLA